MNKQGFCSQNCTSVIELDCYISNITKRMVIFKKNCPPNNATQLVPTPCEFA